MVVSSWQREWRGWTGYGDVEGAREQGGSTPQAVTPETGEATAGGCLANWHGPCASISRVYRLLVPGLPGIRVALVNFEEAARVYERG